MGKRRSSPRPARGTRRRVGAVCALFVLRFIATGPEDVRPQRLNVFRMRLLARRCASRSRSRTLKDAIHYALVLGENVADTYYLLVTRWGRTPTRYGADFPKRHRR